MRALLFCAVLLIGCSKKSDTKTEPASGAQDEATAGAPAQPAPEAPSAEKAAEKPAEAPAAPAAAPSVDCAALVTADDIQKHCNAKVEIAASQHEGKMGKLGVCVRVITEPGKKFPIAHWKLAVHDSPAAAESNVKLDQGDGAKDIGGLGDMAWTREHEMKKLKNTAYTVGVRKGANVLVLHYTKDSLNKNPPCTLDQLVEVARAATARLP